MAYGKGVNWSGSTKELAKSKATAFIIEFQGRPVISLPIAVHGKPSGVVVAKLIAASWNGTDEIGNIVATAFFDPFTFGGTVTFEARFELKILRMAIKFADGVTIEIPEFGTGDFGYGKAIHADGFQVRNVRPGILFPPY